MKFPENLSNIDAPQHKRPEGYFNLVVVGVKDVKSRSGNQQLMILFDIADGPYEGYFNKYPLRYYRPYIAANGDSKEFLAATKKDLINFVKSNDGLLSEEDINADEFDHTRLVALNIGGFIGKDKDGKYLQIKYLVPTNVVDEKSNENEYDEPASASNAEDELPF